MGRKGNLAIGVETPGATVGGMKGMKAGINMSFSKLRRAELGEKETKEQLKVNFIFRNVVFPMKFKTLY